MTLWTTSPPSFPSRWQLSYAEHYARLTTVLHDNATTAEIAAARQSATDADRTPLSSNF